MSKGFKHGAGDVLLNFCVVDGLEARTNPRENTIWIHTDTPISEYYFSSVEPANPADKAVWIQTGTCSFAEFNALKKNCAKIYPLYAFQYLENAWVKKPAQSFQNGTWVDWYVYLFNAGDSCNVLTGGYEEVIGDGSGTDGGSTEMTADAIYVYAYNYSTGHGRLQGRSTVNAIELTGVQTIRAVGYCTQAYEYDEKLDTMACVGIRVASKKSLENADKVKDIHTEIVGDFDLTLDVSTLSGKYYIIPYAEGYGGKTGEGMFTQIWYQ